MPNSTKSPAKAPTEEQKPNVKAGEAPEPESAATTTEKPQAEPEATTEETPAEETPQKASNKVKAAKAKKPTRKCFACQKKVGDIYMVMSELRMRLCLDCGMEALDEVLANADNPDYE